jgi:hypothetical protein
MKDYTEIFRNTYANVIEENKKQNQKKFRKILYKNTLLGLATLLLIMIIILISKMNTLGSFEEAGKSLFETSQIIIKIILLQGFIQLCVVLFSLNKKPEEVNEKLQKLADTFVNDYIRKDILNIMYSNFPPLIQSNMENKIDTDEIFKALTPRVSVDHTGHLSIYDVQINYKGRHISYTEGLSTCYLEKIIWQDMYGKFKFHFIKVDPDLTVKDMDPIEFAPED